MFGQYIGDQTWNAKLEGSAAKLFYSVTRRSRTMARVYLKLVNASSTAQPVEIDFAGTKLAGDAKLITLSANSTQATNTIAHPDQVVPVETALHNVASHLSHSVPAFSIQVIQFTQQ